MSSSHPRTWLFGAVGIGLLAWFVAGPATQSQQPEPPKKKSGAVGKTSYDQIAPVILGQETFAERLAKDKAGKPKFAARQKKLLEERYDLERRDHDKVKMSRGKPVPVGPTARLPEGMTFTKLGEMSPE